MDPEVEIVQPASCQCACAKRRARKQETLIPALVDDEICNCLVVWSRARSRSLPSVSARLGSRGAAIRSAEAGESLALGSGYVFFERVGMLKAGEFNGKSALNTTHDAALNLSEHHESSHLGLGVASDRCSRQR